MGGRGKGEQRTIASKSRTGPLVTATNPKCLLSSFGGRNTDALTLLAKRAGVHSDGLLGGDRKKLGIGGVDGRESSQSRTGRSWEGGRGGSGSDRCGQ